MPKRVNALIHYLSVYLHFLPTLLRKSNQIHNFYLVIVVVVCVWKVIIVVQLSEERSSAARFKEFFK